MIESGFVRKSCVITNAYANNYVWDVFTIGLRRRLVILIFVDKLNWNLQLFLELLLDLVRLEKRETETWLWNL